MKSAKIPQTWKASKNARKRGLQANRIPRAFAGLIGFGHGLRWEGMRYYYPRKRRTRKQIEEEARNSRTEQEVEAENSRIEQESKEAETSRAGQEMEEDEALDRLESIIRGHLEFHEPVDALSDAILCLGISEGDMLALPVSPNTDFVAPPTGMSPEAFEPLMLQSDHSDIFAAAPTALDYYLLYLAEVKQHNDLQEREQALSNCGHNRHDEFNYMTSPEGYESQAGTSGIAEYFGNSLYGNLMADETIVSVPTVSMAGGQIGDGYTLGQHYANQ